VNAQALEFGTDKDRVDDVTSAVLEVLLAWKPDMVLCEGDDQEGKELRKMQRVHEEYQEAVMKAFVVKRVEDCEQNEAYGTGYGGDDCADGENLLGPGCVMCEFADVSKPALREKTESKEYD
jgi:hypothetical protein